MSDAPSQGDGRPVAVGVDGSTGSEVAVEFAAWEAGWRGVPLELVHGFVEPKPFGSFRRHDEGSEGKSSFRDQASAALTKLTERVQKRHPELTVRSRIESGSGAHV